MNTNNVDKVYLALELTKLTYSDRQNYKSSSVYGTYEYFLKKLTNIDDIVVVDDYKEEIEDLKKKLDKVTQEYRELKSSCNSSVKTHVDLIKEYVNVNGGNMEPDVKKQLLRLLDTIFD